MGRYRRTPHVSPPAGPTDTGGIPSCAAVPAAATHAVSAAAALPATTDARARPSAPLRSAAAARSVPGPASTRWLPAQTSCSAVHADTASPTGAGTGPAAVLGRTDRVGYRAGRRTRCHRCRHCLARNDPVGAAGSRHRGTHHHKDDLRRVDHDAHDGVHPDNDDPDNDYAEHSAATDG